MRLGASRGKARFKMTLLYFCFARIGAGGRECRLWVRAGESGGVGI
jgi:hypothetical protein